MRNLLLILLSVLFSITLPVAAEAGPLEEALTLDRQGFVEETVPLWKQFLATGPKPELEIYATIKLCIAFSNLGQLGEAMEAAKILGERFPEDFHAQFNLGNMTSAVQLYPEAVQAYRKVVALHPEEGLAQVGLGLSLFGDQKADEAVEILRRARKLFKEQKNISWYQNVRIMIGQLKSFAPYPPDFSNLWLNNNLKTVRDTYHRSLFLEYEKELGF